MLFNHEVLEIRGHARGGQGLVTAFEILARIFSLSDNYKVQAFPSFGVERTGAPIQAFLRLSEKLILNRSNIYKPHLIVVYDESLPGQLPIFQDLGDDGIILINTEKDPSEFKNSGKHIFTVPATRISLELGLGSKSLPIVNSAMTGAVIRILNGNLKIAKEIIIEEVPSQHEKNALSAELAYYQIKEYHNESFLKESDKKNNSKTKIDVDSFFMPFWDKPMSLNKTGDWRVLTPFYVNRPAPCSVFCPAGTDVRKFIRLASENNFQSAYQTIMEHNPFPSTCGRVCPHFCMQNCNRQQLDESVNIGAIEWAVGDFGLKHHTSVKNAIIHREKIAIIGSGPAGLTAAFQLRKKGYTTKVYEAMAEPGGMMRSGIPNFRLPTEVIDSEIQSIRDCGVEIVVNQKVTIKELEKEYQLIIAATGSHISQKMNVKGENYAIQGIDFLKNFHFRTSTIQINKGDKVAVIGGGNTAMDVARTLIRLGACPIIIYRRSRKEMPAIHEEVEDALREGVEFMFLTAPLEIKQKDGKLFDLLLTKMVLTDPDSSGRRKPVPETGSEFILPFNYIFSAIGQQNDDFIFENLKTKINQGKINYLSNVPVFCCGDMAGGGTITEAIGSGNEVAREVIAFLNNKSFATKSKPNGMVKSNELNHAYYQFAPTNQHLVNKTSSYYNNYSEIRRSLNPIQVNDEASRCLHCGDCFYCGNCINFCPDAAISWNEISKFTINLDYCKGCGICSRECPCSAISMVFSEEEIKSPQLYSHT